MQNTRIRVGAHVSMAPRGKKKTWTVDFRFQGEHHRKSLKTINKKVALNRALKLDAELSVGIFQSLPSEEIITIDEAIEICALRQVRFDNWHASNTKGNYVAFNADFVELERDNQDYLGNRAVIAKLNNYIAFGQIDMESNMYKCKSIELAE